MPEYPNLKPKKKVKSQQTPEQMLQIFEAFASRQNAKAKGVAKYGR